MATIALRRGLLPGLLVLGGIGAFIGLQYLGNINPPASRPERSWAVTTVVVERGPASPEIRGFGTIWSAGSVELRPQVSGLIVRISPALVEGGTVKAGETLLEIDPRDLQAVADDRLAAWRFAEARLAEARVDLDQERQLIATARERQTIAARDRTRAEDLAGRGVGAAAATDAARMAELEARQAVIQRSAGIERMETRLAQLEAQALQAAVALEQAERDLTETRLTAPADGFITEVNAAIGRRVGENDRIAVLIDLTRLEARFQLPWSDVASLIGVGAAPAGPSGPDASAADVMGRPVTVSWALGDHSLSWQARISRTAAQIDPSTGTMDLFARLEPLPPATPLRPGAFVSVTLADRVYEDVVSLPATAVLEDRWAYVVQRREVPEGPPEVRLEQRAVEVVRRVGETVLVRGDLTPGDRVVRRRFPEIGPGIKVWDSDAGTRGSGGSSRPARDGSG